MFLVGDSNFVSVYVSLSGLAIVWGLVRVNQHCVFSATIAKTFSITTLSSVPSNSIIARRRKDFLLGYLQDFFFAGLHRRFPRSVLFVSMMRVVFPKFCEEGHPGGRGLKIFVVC